MNEDLIIPNLNIAVIQPVIVVVVWSLILMFIDLYIPKNKKEVTGWLAFVGLVATLLAAWTQWNHPGGAFGVGQRPPMVVIDNYAVFLNVLYAIAGIFTVLLSVSYLKRAKLESGEFYFLMLFSIAGMMLMGMANDLILVFLALELLSIPLYILAGINQGDGESEEAALKYFLLGAFSSGFFLFGIALTYGATGTTVLPEIVGRLNEGGVLGLAGVAMLLVGFAFKVGAAPFHMWTPDVYEGAPTAVTAFMSVGAKIGGFAAMIRVLMVAFPTLGAKWGPALAVIAAITMILGNVAAISQNNIKRMLAFSSIAHAGYILMGVAAGLKSAEGVSSTLYYMMAYLFTNMGAFAIVMTIERHEGKKGLMLADYKGLAKRNLVLAVALAYLMFSFVGIPLTGGFTGKFFLFKAAIDADLTWLVVIGALTSVVSAYYYLRPVVYSFMYTGPGRARLAWPTAVVISVAVAVTLYLGFFPAQWYAIAQQAVMGAVKAVAAGG